MKLCAKAFPRGAIGAEGKGRGKNSPGPFFSFFEFSDALVERPVWFETRPFAPEI
jgi:hypothetical protein